MDKENKKDKSEMLEKAKAFFERAQAYESAQRAEELDDIRFVGLLEQWPDDIRRIREGDPQGARPCLTVDKVNQYKNQIVNNIRMNSPSIKVRPVDDKADAEVAEVMNGIIRHIESESKADLAYDWASEGSVDSGVGFFRIVTEYVHGTFQQEIKIKKIPNRFSVYRDPDSYEIDGSDQKECLITEMMTRKAFKKMYPNAKPCEWASSSGDTNTWVTENEVRIAEYFCCDYEKDTLYLLESGDSIYASEYEEKYKDAQKPVIIDKREASRKIVRWAKLSGEEVLEESVFAGSYIPVIPVFGIVTVVDGRMYWRGIVRGAKDPQRMYNYNRSTIAESLSLTVKAPFIGATGQFKTTGKRWAAANRVNFAYLEYDPVTTNGQLAPPPQRQGFAGVPAGLLQDIQTSEHDIQAGLGMYQASLGQDSNAKSGRALNAQRQQGDIATFHFPDNLAKSVAHAGKIIVEIIPKYYDTQRVIRILGEDGSQEFAKIDPTQEEAVSEYRDEENEVNKIYNLGVGKYDVIATSGASFATKREEGAEFLTTLAQSNPDLMPVIGDLLFKSLDVPYAEEVAERLKKIQPPELKDDEEGNNPQVQAVMQQAEQVKIQATEMINELQNQLAQAGQAVQEREQALAEEQARAKDNEAKLMLESEKIEIERYKAETDRLKVELDAVQKQTEQTNDSLERLDMLEQAIALLIDKTSPEVMVEELPI